MSSTSSQTPALPAAPFSIQPFPGFLVSGNTKPYAPYFKKLGGKWCVTLEGWLFDELLRPSVEGLMQKVVSGELPALAEASSSGSSSSSLPASSKAPKEPKEPKNWREDMKADGTRTGKRWTEPEKEELALALEAGVPLHTIAADHKRTEGAIDGKVNEVIDELHKQGKSIDEIMMRTGQSMDRVAEIIKFGVRGNWREKQKQKGVAQVEMPQGVVDRIMDMETLEKLKAAQRPVDRVITLANLDGGQL